MVCVECSLCTTDYYQLNFKIFCSLGCFNENYQKQETINEAVKTEINNKTDKSNKRSKKVHKKSTKQKKKSRKRMKS